MMSGAISLYKWQESAINLFCQSENKAIFQVPTGSGKTIAAIALIQSYVGRGIDVLVISPTIPIMLMWQEKIKKSIPEQEVALFYGEKKEWGHITVSVMNSLWKTEIPQRYLFVVIDEAHHSVSPESWKVIESVKNRHLLALTATIERSDERHALIEQIIPTKFVLSQCEAINDGIISSYTTHIVQVRLGVENQKMYDDINNQFIEVFEHFGYDWQYVSEVIKNYYHPSFLRAKKYHQLMTQRKGFLNNAPEKIESAIQLIQSLNSQGKKIIVFNERIESISRIAQKCQELGITAISYHSKIKSKERTKTLDLFAKGDVNILISAKCLDQGIDIPSVDTAIIVSGNSTEKQIIQRLGRILRKQEDKKADFYYLYIANTKEEDYKDKMIEYVSDSTDQILYQ